MVFLCRSLLQKKKKKKKKKNQMTKPQGNSLDRKAMQVAGRVVGSETLSLSWFWGFNAGCQRAESILTVIKIKPTLVICNRHGGIKSNALADVIFGKTNNIISVTA
jgi:hypothetical protein